MDTAILYNIQSALGNPALDTFFAYFTYLGEAGAVWIVIGLCMLASKKWRMWGVCVLVSLAMVGLFNELGLKHLVGRPRPYLVEGYEIVALAAPSGFSFPSGHTGCSFAAATVITMSPAKKQWKILVWILALLIAFSRLYLFVHYPSDVLVGALLGVLYGFIAVKVVQHFALARQR